MALAAEEEAHKAPDSPVPMLRAVLARGESSDSDTGGGVDASMARAERAAGTRGSRAMADGATQALSGLLCAGAYSSDDGGGSDDDGLAGVHRSVLGRRRSSGSGVIGAKLSGNEGEGTLLSRSSSQGREFEGEISTAEANLEGCQVPMLSFPCSLLNSTTEDTPAPLLSVEVAVALAGMRLVSVDGKDALTFPITSIRRFSAEMLNRRVARFYFEANTRMYAAPRVYCLQGHAMIIQCLQNALQACIDDRMLLIKHGATKSTAINPGGEAAEVPLEQQQASYTVRIPPAGQGGDDGGNHDDEKGAADNFNLANVLRTTIGKTAKLIATAGSSGGTKNSSASSGATSSRDSRSGSGSAGQV